MDISSLKGQNLGAKEFMQIPVYDTFGPSGKLVYTYTSHGGNLSNIVDIQGVFNPAGANQVWFGIQDENGLSWVEYFDDVYTINGSPLFITQSDIDAYAQASKQSLLSNLNPINWVSNILAPLKPYAVGIGVVALLIIIAKSKKK